MTSLPLQFQLQNNLKMKKVTTTIKAVAALLIAAATLTFTSCTNNGGNSSNLQAKVDSLQNELKKFADERALTELRLAKFSVSPGSPQRQCVRIGTPAHSRCSSQFTTDV